MDASKGSESQSFLPEVSGSDLRSAPTQQYVCPYKSLNPSFLKSAVPTHKRRLGSLDPRGDSSESQSFLPEVSGSDYDALLQTADSARQESLNPSFLKSAVPTRRHAARVADRAPVSILPS